MTFYLQRFLNVQDSGLVDEGTNLFKPFASLALPLGLMPTIKHKATEDDKKTKN